MLCVGATLFSGGLRVKPVGRWVIWREGGGGEREPADRPVNSLKIIMVTKKKKSFGLTGAEGGATWPATGKNVTFAA